MHPEKTDQRLVAQVVARASEVLPVLPDHISQFQGSVLELKKVGVAEVDVDVTHRLRANFDSRISQQGTNLVLELTGAGTNDQKYMGNGISSAAEVNNQNLVSSSHAGAMTNKQPLTAGNCGMTDFSMCKACPPSLSDATHNRSAPRQTPILTFPSWGSGAIGHVGNAPFGSPPEIAAPALGAGGYVMNMGCLYRTVGHSSMVLQPVPHMEHATPQQALSHQHALSTEPLLQQQQQVPLHTTCMTDEVEDCISPFTAFAEDPPFSHPSPKQLVMANGSQSPAVADEGHKDDCHMADVNANGQLAVDCLDQSARCLGQSAHCLGQSAHNQILQQSAWLLDSSRIALGRRLAVGGFAEVFLGRMEGALVAVKRLVIYDDDSVRRFSHEVDVLSRLRHPNLIQFMGYTLLPEPTIVSEFMSRGSLFHILRRRNGQP
eukprot:gene5882-32489_t